MRILLRRTVFILVILCGSNAFLYSQYSTRNNYTGLWMSSTSWDPLWNVPQTNVTDNNTNVNGYITSNSSLSFSGASYLTVKDTLVIKGNLDINDNNKLKVEDAGILIVLGNLTLSYDTQVEVNGYIIVTGDIIKIGDTSHGQFKSNDNPVHIFIEGAIPSGLTDHNNQYQALDCTSSQTLIYTNSLCSYGNMNDLKNDPISPFFQSVCTATTPAITAGGPTTFCEGGSVTLTSSQGTTYLWSTGETARSITVYSAGNYSVRITNSNGCQSAASVPVIVTVNTLPAVPVIGADGPTTFCAGEDVTLSTGAATSYLWSTGATTQSITLADAGTYSVKVTNSNGCQSALSSGIIVTVNDLPPAPLISAAGPTTFCNGGSVTLTSSPGADYFWSTGASTQSINVTSSGNYSVSVTNAKGCKSAVSVAVPVTVNPLPAIPSISAGGPTTFCEGGSVILTSSAGTGYLWSTGAATPSITANGTGNYTVRITNSSGCQSAVSGPVVVTENALPATPIISASGPTTFCKGGNVILTSGPATSYLWSTGAITQSVNVTEQGVYSVSVKNANGCTSAISSSATVTINSLPVVNAGPDIIIPLGTSTTIDAKVTGTGPFTYSWEPSGSLINAMIEDPLTTNLSSTTIYTLTATSSATSCSDTGTVTISVSGGPLNSTPAANPSTVCQGTPVQLRALTGGGSGSYSYSWTSSPSGFSSDIANPVVNPLVNTTYYLSVFDGFSTINSQVTVTVNAMPSLPVVSAGGPTTFCSGGSVNLSSGTGTGYLWSTGETTQSIIVSTSGSYSVKVTNANGCVSASSAPAIVTVNALPATPTIIADGPTTFCNGGSVTLSSSTGENYLWSTGATTQNIDVNSEGSYSVSITDANGCQSEVSSITVVTTDALPATPVITANGPVTFCDGGSVTLTSGVATTFLWSTGETTQSIVVTSSGSYSLIVTNPNGCQSAPSAAINVTVNPVPPVPVISPGGPVTFCEGETITLTSATGTGYLWSTGETSQSIDVNSSGNYSVQVTNTYGCKSGVSLPVSVDVNTLPVTPTISADGPTAFCTGGSVTLTSSLGATYLWSTGETANSINVTKAGNIFVRVTDSDGCQSAQSVEMMVTVNDLPPTPVITPESATTFCDGGNVTLTTDPETAYLWSTGEISQSVLITSSGNYTVNVINADGCQSESSLPVTVVVNSLPQVSITGESEMCLNGQISLTGNPPGGVFSLTDGPGNILGNVLTASAPGNINIEYLYSDICTNTAKKTIAAKENPVADAGPDQVLKYLFETNLEGNLSGSETGEWSIISGSARISDIHSPGTLVTGLAVGENIFLWSVTGNNCEATDEVSVMVSDLVIPSVITPNGDGKNDSFRVSDIGSRAELLILNRWGELEYKSDNYSNDWDGRNMKGKALPGDTYFYILKFENGIIRKGTILIVR